MNESQVLSAIADLKADIKILLEQKQDCDKMESTLYGNGREGITTTVSKLEASIGSFRWWLRGIAIALVPLVYKAFF